MEELILGTILLLAVYYDNRQNRIPNRLCAAGSILGLAMTLYMNGFEGMKDMIWTVGIWLCLFPLWMLRMIGGGDVKLAMTAAIILGKNVIPFFLCTGCCIGVHAFIVLIVRKNYFRRLSLFFQYVIDCWKERRIKKYPFDLKQDGRDGGIRISYGMLAGHVLAVIMGMYY